MRLAITIAIGVCTCALSVGCSGDDDDMGRPAGQGGGSGVGGTAGSSGSAAGASGAGGGGAGSGGTGSAAGQGGGGGNAGAAGSGAGQGGDDGDDAGVDECVYDGPAIVDPADLDSCETDTCQNAHCLDRSFVSAEQAEALRDCDAQNECVPDLLITTVGQFLLESCRSLGDAEGRCLSTCVPQVEAQLDVLPRDVCDEDERCAPCFDPITGEETGACGQSCDPGPTEDPIVFADCCGELGACVPEALVPDDQRAILGTDSCTGEGELCAPRALAGDPDAVPATCSSLGGAEGRCLAACLPDIAAQADRLPSAGCAAGELCAPCFDPLSGEDTGACTIGDDEPAEDPLQFADCCGGRSACVPEALVSEAQRSLLDGTGCGSGELCAPKDIASGSYEPERCTSWGGAEGRCLLACLPDVAAQSARLERDICDAEQLCVPCFDPVSGDSTGACEIEGDEPEDSPPYVFPTCCDNGAGSDLGTCVPAELVSSAEQALLGADSCSDDGFLCAPTSLASDSYVPDTCASWLGAEGRCLPACLPDVDAQRDRLRRDTCGQGELCVPCYDPVSGDDTGACSIRDDEPVEDPERFPTCCTTAGVPRGTCVPTQAAGEQADSLPTLTCETATGDADTYVCAPNERIEDPDFQFPSCDTTCGADAITCALAVIGGVTGQDGACVPSCLLAERATPIGNNAANLYGQSTCDTGEDCAPCVDPNTDEPTGLCD